MAALRAAVPVLATAGAPVGYWGDELYYLACAERLAWGYVDHPPLSVAILAGWVALFGNSLVALRSLAGLCEAGAVVATGFLARELGGGRRAQLLAATAFAVAPAALALGFPWSMNALEHLQWPTAALVLARLLGGGNPRGWLLLGALLGAGLLNKLGTLGLGAGLAVGLALSARGWLTTRWPWLAAAVAVAIFVPHLVWQLANDLPTLEWIRNNATAREGLDAAVVMRTPWAFVGSQIAAIGPVAAPLWIGGLVHLLRGDALRHQRVLASVFLVPFVLLTASGRASFYYLVAAYPIVIAAGAVAVERRAAWRRWAFGGLVVQGLLALPVCIPMLSPERYLEASRAVRAAVGADPEDAILSPAYTYLLGWPELTDAVAEAVARLAPAERERAGVLATTFGEAGALAHFGPARGLPPVVGTHNSFWMWGPGDLDGDVLVVVADGDDPILDALGVCSIAARVDCRHCDPALRGRPVFVCRDPRRPLRDLWPGLKRYT